MNPKQSIIALGALVVVLGGAWYWYQGRQTTTQDQIVAEQFEWGFVDQGVDPATSMPKTRVLLRVAGVEVPVGTYNGNCFAIKGSAWKLQPGELSGAICYFAGGGTEVGVFKDGNELVLKEGIVEEGGAEEPGFRGNFKVIKKPL